MNHDQTRTRRAVLQAVGGGSVVGLAGCLGTDVDDRLDQVTIGTESPPESSAVEEITTVSSHYGVSVRFTLSKEAHTTIGEVTHEEDGHVLSTASRELRHAPSKLDLVNPWATPDYYYQLGFELPKAYYTGVPFTVTLSTHHNSEVIIPRDAEPLARNGDSIDTTTSEAYELEVDLWEKQFSVTHLDV